MTTESLEHLRSIALKLPEAERAELAHDLVCSLDAPDDEGVAEASDTEILRRIAEVDAGSAAIMDREEFRRKIQERILGT